LQSFDSEPSSNNNARILANENVTATSFQDQGTHFGLGAHVTAPIDVSPSITGLEAHRADLRTEFGNEDWMQDIEFWSDMDQYSANNVPPGGMGIEENGTMYTPSAGMSHNSGSGMLELEDIGEK
jgi:hypothetical protein